MPQLTQFNALMPVQAFQAGRDQRNQRIGGEFQNALLEGNLDQARSLAQRSGDADMMGEYRTAIQQMNEQQRAEALQRTQVLGGAAEWALQNVPPDQLDTYVRQQLAPQLAAAGYDISEYLPEGLPITQDALGTFVAMAQGAAGELTAYLDRNPGTREIGQYDALVQQRGGQQNVTLNEQGTRALDEQNRSNVRDEELRDEANSIAWMNANTSRQNADTTAARLEYDRTRGNSPEWITLEADDPRRAGFDPGEVVQYNTRTGQVARRSVDRVFNATESQAAGFAGRMNDASSVIDQFEAQEGFRVPEFLWSRPTRTLPAEWQQYRQAGENWIRANLRRESGAVIGEEEMAAEFRVYFPQPGDSPEVIRQKARARQRAEQSMIAQSRGAYEEYGLDQPLQGGPVQPPAPTVPPPPPADDLSDRAGRYLVQ
jgi:hypothetical protein